jgi:hypothetical protein
LGRSYNPILTLLLSLRPLNSNLSILAQHVGSSSTTSIAATRDSSSSSDRGVPVVR